MSTKKTKKPVEQAETHKHWQSFKVLKRFPTDEKVYEVGEIFRHYDKRVINFLKSKNII